MIKIEAQSPAGPASFSIPSGELLRQALLEQKVDIYDLWGKVRGGRE